MMLQTLFATLLSAAPGTPTVEWQSPASFLEGGGTFNVKLTVRGGEEGGALAGWALTPAGFVVNGQPVMERAEGAVQLVPGSVTTVEFDLAPYLLEAPGFDREGFTLAFAEEYAKGEPITVKTWQAAPQGLNFMELPAQELGNYLVVLSTNRGEMVAEFWPETAPNHVRNFLDLSYTGFYDGVTFHRVIPGFMIQGGDPTGTGTGNGKRSLDAEFSNKKHVRGVLSMARSNDPNSASCQFFVMHAAYPSLDGQYSAFGQLREGLDVVDLIVNTPRDPGSKPLQPQVIQKATVVLKPQR
jgi:cyclophilin family peptidyl-prolyl cis-trans isomerase